MSLFFGRFRFLLCQEKVFDAACKEVHKIVDGFIDDVSAAHECSSSENRKSKTYNLLGELSEVVRNRSELKFQLLNVFLPAYDSTAIGLSNIFFHLVRHPRVWDRLYLEAIAVEEPITAERVKSMTYLEYVINEGEWTNHMEMFLQTYKVQALDFIHLNHASYVDASKIAFFHGEAVMMGDLRFSFRKEWRSN